jgi:catechol 2,3-dioxygenase-like lactoylglutathione lyase family enzyme
MSEIPDTETLLSGLNHVVVLTADLDRLCGFYTEVFGIEAVDAPAPPGTRVALLRISATAGFNIWEVPDSAHTRGSATMLERGHIDHIAFEAPNALALDEVRRRLIERGASDGHVSDYGAVVCVPFTDPDGMATEICWTRDPSLSDLHEPRPSIGSLRAADSAS